MRGPRHERGEREATEGIMFGRNKNRRRRSWRDRGWALLSRIWDALVGVAPWVAAIVVAVGLPYGAVSLYLGAASSTHFDIEEVRVEGAEYLSGDELARRAHIVEGMNVLDIEEARAEGVLESDPWVREATVETQLPGEAVVTIDEREPVALLADAKWAIVDDTHEAFKKLDREDPIDRLLELPLITGLEPADLRRERGRRWLDRALHATGLYRRFELDEDATLSEIHVDQTMGVSLVTEDGTEIRLGRDHYRQRLGRLGAVRRELDRRSVDPSYLLMDLGQPLRRVAVGRRRKDHGGSTGTAEAPEPSGRREASTDSGEDQTREGH